MSAAPRASGSSRATEPLGSSPEHPRRAVPALPCGSAVAAAAAAAAARSAENAAAGVGSWRHQGPSGGGGGPPNAAAGVPGGASHGAPPRPQLAHGAAAGMGGLAMVSASGPEATALARLAAAVAAAASGRGWPASDAPAAQGSLGPAGMAQRHSGGGGAVGVPSREPRGGAMGAGAGASGALVPPIALNTAAVLLGARPSGAVAEASSRACRAPEGAPGRRDGPEQRRGGLGRAEGAARVEAHGSRQRPERPQQPGYGPSGAGGGGMVKGARNTAAEGRMGSRVVSLGSVSLGSRAAGDDALWRSSAAHVAAGAAADDSGSDLDGLGSYAEVGRAAWVWACVGVDGPPVGLQPGFRAAAYWTRVGLRSPVVAFHWRVLSY